MRRRHDLLAAETGLVLALGLTAAAFRFAPDVPLAPPPAAPAEPEPFVIVAPPPTRHDRPPAPVAQRIAAPPVPVDVEALAEVLPEVNEPAAPDEPLARPAPPPIPDLPDLPLPPVHRPVEEGPEVFVVVEQMPELIGGLESLRPEYPEMERRAGVEGRVFLQFVVNEDGSVSEVTVTRGVSPELDRAAMEAVRRARFQPGMQRGRPVRVRFALPVSFSLYRP